MQDNDRRANGRPIRVLVAKPGLDGHDRGAKVIARALRDSGMEVIYTGIRQSPQMIAQAAAQEDVDVIVVVGGIIPEVDRQPLKDLGISEVFGPGTSTGAIVEFIRESVKDRTGT